MALPILNTLSDNFNGAADPRRINSSGVSQASGALQVDAVDATRRASYIQVDARSSAVSYRPYPPSTDNAITAVFLRSTANPLQQIRVAVFNGVIYGSYDAGSVDALRSGRPYNSTTDAYWRIRHDGSLVHLETSPDGSSWTPLGRTAFTGPGWLSDCAAGVEVYTGVSL